MSRQRLKSNRGDVGAGGGVFVAVLLTGIALAAALAVPAQAGRRVEPVYPGLAADPAVVQTADGFFAFATGKNAPGFSAPTAEGPWEPIGPRLTSTGSWAKDASIWAPDVQQVSGDHWVMYYAALVHGLDARQRCIGVADSQTGPAGPFTPQETPLSCPAGATRADGTPLNASDQPPTPQPGDGLIDASAFTTNDGRRFVLYKTQRPQPVTAIRVVEVDASWSKKLTGTTSVELRRHIGQIENPVVVQRGEEFVLFASKGPYGTCAYSTVWWRSNAPDSGFADADEHDLMTMESNRVCGPGGADVVTKASGARSTIFFHGWTCDAAHRRTCTVEEAEANPAPPFKVRAMFAGVLVWRGSTPRVVAYL